MSPTRRLSLLLALALGACAAPADSSPDAEDAVAFVDGKTDGSGYTECELETAVAHLNDPSTTADGLKADGLHSRAANNLIEHRDGADGVAGTADDDLFADIVEVDDVYWVGPVAIEQLVAIVTGLCAAPTDSNVEVFLSPQPKEVSHLARAVELIDGAERSLDVAMYSFRDGDIEDALERAVDRGIRVRLILEKANEDRRDPEGSLSAGLEDAGMDVRYVNKIMHHKFLLVDGPQESADQAAESILMTGSANWSYSAATRYDENTLVFTGYPELALRYQREFDRVWQYSRDFVWGDFEQVFTTPVEDAAIEAADQGEMEALFTSANFRTYESSRYGWTFSRERGRAEVANRLVELIEGATDRILIASGHLRSRQVAEALLAKVQENPTLDVRVYLDAQEYLSEWYHSEQVADREDCLAEAEGSAARTEDCLDYGFLYAYELVQAGVDVRFKYYSYRWHYSYAEQMHHKYLIIDDQLVTGSYNLSANAEYDTLENVVVLRGLRFATVVERFAMNFATLWETGRAEGLYDDLMADVLEGDDEFPIVFDSMALTWQEVDDLKAAMRDACAELNSDDFRRYPERHYRCDPSN
jgi:phosphatidylserine/phosphatidylglycerophosphate/cardiolipin synthase-like enzyme